MLRSAMPAKHPPRIYVVRRRLMEVRRCLGVEAVKRKRVTQVGSGAWSIYLPKKWIDSWIPEQQAGREVDLHRISNSLLVVPVRQDRSFHATIPPRPDTVRTLLLSAYVRGHDAVELRPDAGAFDRSEERRVGKECRSRW